MTAFDDFVIQLRPARRLRAESGRSARRAHAAARVVLLAVTCAAAVAPLAAQQELRTCEQAVASLLSGTVRPEARDVSRERGFGDRTVSWQAPDGSRGICRVDDRGRVYAAEVESFGGGDAGGGATYSVSCESTNGRRRECEIRGPARVRLARQLSKGACREGETWGTYGDRLWVDDGCRAVFEVAPAGAGSGGWGEEALARTARAACENKAKLQGMDIYSVASARRIDRQRWQVEMRVGTRGIRFDAACSYFERTGYVEISGK